MDPLRSTLDKLHPTFTEGSLKPLYPLYEALDTFLYTPGEVTTGSTQVRDALDLKRMMSTVVVALAPAILWAMFNTGYQANLTIASIEGATLHGWQGSIWQNWLGFQPGEQSILGNVLLGALYLMPIYIVVNIAGGLSEVVFSIIRKHEVNEGFLVTGWLFPLTCPPTVPLWQVAVGIIFAVVVAKEVFGGTGKNFLNIALTARAFCYFAYTSDWGVSGIWTAANVDGASAATPLDAWSQGGLEATTDVAGYSWLQCFFGLIPGSLGETSAFAALLGALILTAAGIANWRIMVSIVLGVVGGAVLFNVIGSDTNPMFSMPFWWHLAIGGLAFGLVFMATDPVSSTMTMWGHWIYGGLIGFLTVAIRVLNPGYPEGIMLAILFGNVFAPVIDYGVVQRNIKRRLARAA